MINAQNDTPRSLTVRAGMQSDTVVYIVEAEPMIRHFIEVSITSMGFTSVPLQTLEQLPSLFNGNRPGCILVGTQTEGAAETTWMTAFLESNPTARPILITVGCKVASAVNAMKHGFSSVLEYPFTFEQFSTAVNDAVAESEERIASESNRLPVTVTRLLTAQEEDIVSLLMNGAATKEIAVRLNLSVRTIHYRKNAIFKKVGANSRSHLMQILTRPNGRIAESKSDPMPISA